MLKRIGRPSPAAVIALLALFVALGGTAVAAGVVPLAKRALVADNAKKLGGKTAAQIAATPSPAADAAQIAAMPSPAATAAGLVVIKTQPWSQSPGQGSDLVISCDAGQKVVAGGYEDPGGWTHSWDTRPTPDGGSWHLYVYTSSYASGPQSGTLYAICLK